MAVKTKCIYEKPAPADGYRVLVMRYWPRGVTKEKAKRWEKKLGAPADLIKKWKSSSINWADFSKQYLKSVKLQKNKIDELADLANKKDITLLCSCHDEGHCHRYLLKKLIEKQILKNKVDITSHSTNRKD